MASTYGLVNLISSFGFARRWRAQCRSRLSIGPDHVVADLMSGMGELWPSLSRQIGSGGRIVAVDMSPVMCDGASGHLAAARSAVDIYVEDVLSNSLESECVDCVVSTFGLKTFSGEQLEQLAGQVHRILKPGGVFSFLEISVPPGRLLRTVFMAYLSRGIPLIGRLCLGNPENYRLLSVYTRAFRDCSHFLACLEAAGLSGELTSFFFGCATGVVGVKPDR